MCSTLYADVTFVRPLDTPMLPYSQVQTIFLRRFPRRLEMGQPMTVPGETLETVFQYTGSCKGS